MRILRRLLVTVALVASATLFVPAGPAHAYPHEAVLCSPVGEFQGNDLWYCMKVPIIKPSPEPPGPVDCLTCPPFVDILDKLDWQQQWAYLDRLGQGLRLLGEANLEKDPKVADQLRLQATEQLLESAEILGSSHIDLGTTGWVDLEHHKVYEDPKLELMGAHLIEGLRLMQPPAPGDPTPQPNIEKAMAHFHQAVKELTNLYTG